VTSTIEPDGLRSGRNWGIGNDWRQTDYFLLPTNRKLVQLSSKRNPQALAPYWRSVGPTQLQRGRGRDDQCYLFAKRAIARLEVS
jgi:hypothetical protein